MQQLGLSHVVLFIVLGQSLAGCGSAPSEGAPPPEELPPLGARSPATPPPPEELGGSTATGVENPWLGGFGLGGAPATGGSSDSTPNGSGSGSGSSSGTGSSGIGSSGIGGALASGGSETGIGGAPPPPPTPELLITQYLEGLGSDKALELTNIGSFVAELSRCELWTFANGGTTPYRKSSLAGELAPGQAWVLCGSGASPALEPLCDTVTSAVAHNGDDAFVLRCDEDNTDSFGSVGEDPGNAWGGVISTKDANLVRKCDVATGDALPEDEFSPENEWTSAPLGELADLGVRNCTQLGAGGAGSEVGD